MLLKTSDEPGCSHFVICLGAVTFWKGLHVSLGLLSEHEKRIVLHLKFILCFYVRLRCTCAGATVEVEENTKWRTNSEFSDGELAPCHPYVRTLINLQGNSYIQPTAIQSYSYDDSELLADIDDDVIAIRRLFVNSKSAPVEST